MPHDANGQLLKEGDIVTLRCRVVKIYAGQDMCNLTIEALEGGEVEGYETYRPTLTCNADSVRKADDRIERFNELKAEVREAAKGLGG